MARSNPKRLLVEGADDLRIIPHFMGNFISWGDTLATSPVEIVPNNGIENLLRPGNIEVEFKTAGLTALGVIVDADSDPAGRWASIRQRVVGEMPDIPTELPPNGLVHTHADGRRFGVWIMPDCGSHGMIETFLSLFVPTPTVGLWPFVRAFCDDARRLHAAPCTVAHLDKARIHAWLAVQEPPGDQLHMAIKSRVLRVTSPFAEPFVDWFCRLYGTPRLTSTP